MPQHINATSFTAHDPRAAAAGRKGGRLRKHRAFSTDYLRGYRAGARNARRHTDRWIQETRMASFTTITPFVTIAKRLFGNQLAAQTPEAKHAAAEDMAHFLRMAQAGRLDEWIASHPEHTGGDVDDSMSANPEEKL